MGKEENFEMYNMEKGYTRQICVKRSNETGSFCSLSLAFRSFTNS
jgi:hypothetical protein